MERIYSIWMIIALVLACPNLAAADAFELPIPRKTTSGPRELFSCSLQVTNAYREGFSKRTWVDIKSQPVVLGKSEDILDLQPVFEGPAIKEIFGNGVLFMASLFRDDNGDRKIKFGIYTTRKNLAKYNEDEYFLIPNSIFYAHPVVEQISEFSEGDEFTIELNQAIGLHTSARFTQMNCRHAKSIDGGVN